MKLLDLWNKYQNSGILGAAVITDEELKELSEKLEEFEQFLRANNPTCFWFLINKENIYNVIDRRGKV